MCAHANDADNGRSPAVVLGHFGTRQNSQCSVNVGELSATSSGTTYSVNLAVTLKSAYSGAKNIYGLAATVSGQSSNWRNLGAWTVQ